MEYFLLSRHPPAAILPQLLISSDDVLLQAVFKRLPVDGVACGDQLAAAVAAPGYGLPVVLVWRPVKPPPAMATTKYAFGSGEGDLLLGGKVGQ